MSETCIKCDQKRRGKWRSPGCACYVHRGCIVSVISETVKSGELKCEHCKKIRTLPPYHLALALRKELPLEYPMYYAPSGLVPYVAEEMMKHPEPVYGQRWEEMVAQYRVIAPKWLYKTLDRAKKKRVEPRTIHTKWQ